MSQRRKEKQLGVFAVCFALLFFGTSISVSAGDENRVSSKIVPKEEKEAAMEKTLKELSGKKDSVAAENAEKETPPQEGEKAREGESGSEKKKKDENERIKEKEFFVKAADVFWELSDKKIIVEISGPEKEEVPSGKISFEQEGLVARWKPEASMLLRKKKKNKLDSPWISEIFFLENAVKTKALGAPAPYYALDEIQLHFTELVSYEVIKGRQGLRLEFSPLKKRKPIAPEEVPPAEKETALGESAPFSPGQILGPIYQEKAKYETYILGESKAAEMLGRLQAERKPQLGLFDGTLGFPQDMREVFKEAYPSFGSLEYWKKYVQAAFNQTVGFSSDYDGSYGAWGGFRADNPAMTWTPDLAVGYLRPGLISSSIGYNYQRRCPVSRLLHFADGYQNQTISFGAGYTPPKSYGVFSENAVSLYRSKNLNQNDDGSFTRDGNKGMRMTNALGLNYRLTRKLLWKICGGLEGTRSDNSESGRSRTKMGFLGTDFGYSFSKNLSGGLGYSYRHTFKNTSGPSGPTTTWVKNVKGQNLQAPSIGLNYQPFKRLTLSGSITPAIIDGQYCKFGGITSLKYKLLKADDFSFSYSNAVAQDDTAQLTGRSLAGGIGAAGNVSLSRDEMTTLEYSHRFTTRTMRNTLLSLSFSYHRSLPLQGFSSDTGSLQDGLTFEASLRRSLRSGRFWVEITYRFENYRARALDEDDTLNSSVKEHSVFLSITNYFGQKGG